MLPRIRPKLAVAELSDSGTMSEHNARLILQPFKCRQKPNPPASPWWRTTSESARH